MQLTNQNREDIRSNMTVDEYKNLIIKTLPELNIDKFNPDIPALAKIVAVHLFTNRNLLLVSNDNSFEITQIESITRKVLEQLQKDGIHGLPYK